MREHPRTHVCMISNRYIDNPLALIRTVYRRLMPPSTPQRQAQRQRSVSVSPTRAVAECGSRAAAAMTIVIPA